MADTNAAATFAANEHAAAALPAADFSAQLDVPEGSPSLLAKLNRFGVVSRQWRAVQEYLERYPDLTAVLPAICEQARQEFGPPNELALELYRDPEIRDEYLTLYIRQPRYEADIMPRIERLSDTFSDQVEHAFSYLLLTTDFRSP